MFVIFLAVDFCRRFCCCFWVAKSASRAAKQAATTAAAHPAGRPGKGRSKSPTQQRLGAARKPRRGFSLTEPARPLGEVEPSIVLGVARTCASYLS